MLLVIVTFVFCGILALIAYYDFRYRSIPAYILAVAILFAVIISLISNSLAQAMSFAGINMLLSGLQLGLIVIYFSVKNRAMTNIVNSHIGVGDILFFPVVCFCFSPLNFIIFNTISYLLILIGFTLYKTTRFIPLAGCLSMLLLICVFFSTVLKMALPYQDAWLFQLIILYHG